MKKLNLNSSKLLLSLALVCTVNPCLASAQQASIGQLEKIKQSGYLTMVTNAEFPPFEYFETSDDAAQIVGIDVEIGKAIADKLGVTLKVNNASFESLIFEVKNGQADFSLAGISYTEEKAKNVDFSQTYVTSKLKIIARKNSGIKNEQDLPGKKIGVQLGTVAADYCSKRNDLTVLHFNKDVDAIQDLVNKQIEAVVVDDFTAAILAKNNNQIEVLPDVLAEQEYSAVVNKGNEELLEEINKTIKELKTTGKLNEILDKYEGKGGRTMGFAESVSWISEGLKSTVLMTIFASNVGVVLGVFFALLKVLSKSNKKYKLLGILANIYTTVIRGTPALIQLFIMYYVILQGFRVERIVAAILAFGINSGAYVCEHIRGGINAVDSGQIEAGRSLGLSPKITMLKIVLPQAIKNILPSLAGEAITLLKETAVAGFIGIIDLSKAGDIIKSRTFDPLTPLITVACVYLVMVVGFTYLLSRYERRLKKSDTR